MIKELLHKSLSIALALTVLMSTLSFTIEKHYCGNILVDTAVFSNAEKCGMEMVSKKTTKSKPCCKDEVDVIKGQDELKFSFFEDLKFQKQQFLATFVFTYIYLFEGVDKNVSSFEAYKPPLVIRQLYKIDETYLI